MNMKCCMFLFMTEEAKLKAERDEQERLEKDKAEAEERRRLENEVREKNILLNF